MNTVDAHIYSQMIAGSIPALRMDVEDAIVAIAGGILHDHRLHILSARDDEYVYYYAVPSKCITHTEQLEMPLAMALPGHPQHQGDGIYCLDDAEAPVAVVKRGGEFFLMHVQPSAIQKKAQDYGLQIHTVGASTEPWSLESVYSRQRNSIHHAVAKFARIAGYALGACAAIYMLLAGGELYAERVVTQRREAGSMAETINQFQYASPLSEQLAHFQQISAVVVRAGGWIEGYIWRPGKDEAFEITLPGWVSRDYVETLGSGVVADYNVPDNLVMVRKGHLEKMSKP